jgi:hypothetical protein
MMQEFLIRYEFKITVLMEPTSDQLNNYFKQLSSIAYEKSKQSVDGKRGIALFCYFSGHGVLEATTKILLPSEILCDRKNPYPLEAKLRMIKDIEHTYVIGILDCCREDYTPD